jgi:hypothetical protein
MDKKIISYHQLLTKSSTSLHPIEIVYLQDYFLSDMAIHKLDLGEFDKVDY